MACFLKGNSFIINYLFSEHALHLTHSVDTCKCAMQVIRTATAVARSSGIEKNFDTDSNLIQLS